MLLKCKRKEFYEIFFCLFFKIFFYILLIDVVIRGNMIVCEICIYSELMFKCY